jgi:hypothetical protein
MFKLAFCLLFGAVAAVPAVINSENGSLKLDSPAGRHLMQHARRLQNNANYQYNYNYNGGNYKQQQEYQEEQDRQWDYENMDLGFLTKYSVKFQGCHHVQQWNHLYDAEDEQDVRIKTKRLVRFRLCPSDDCDASTSGCTSKYGDYVVDMETFLATFLEAQTYASQNDMCANIQNTCEETCEGDEECMDDCYQGYDAEECDRRRRHLQEDEDNEEQQEVQYDYIDAMEYTTCTAFDMRRRLDQNQNANGENGYYDEDGNWVEEDIQYYIGPYCGAQGGEINLALFTDDTCTVFANNGAQKFKNAMGYDLPYAEESLVSGVCVPCGEYNNGDAALSEMCQENYPIAGKCETKMNIDYPNESSCGYIEGIKVIREDGVIRTSNNGKSKTAAVFIGLFLTISVLLAGYVYYLRTKLIRAQVNLSAASSTFA